MGFLLMVRACVLVHMVLFRDSQMAWILNSFRWHRYNSEILCVMYAARDVAVLAMSLCLCVIMSRAPSHCMEKHTCLLFHVVGGCLHICS